MLRKRIIADLGCSWGSRCPAIKLVYKVIHRKLFATSLLYSKVKHFRGVICVHFYCPFLFRVLIVTTYLDLKTLLPLGQSTAALPYTGGCVGKIGAPTKTRTWAVPVMSRGFYQLNYWSMFANVWAESLCGSFYLIVGCWRCNLKMRYTNQLVALKD